MKVCTCFLLFGIFAYTNSISQTRTKGDHRVFNLPQDILREYSYEEYSGDTNNLDNAHNIISSGTAVQDKNKNMKLAFKAPRVDTLTDFIQEAVRILNTYEDTAFEDFFHILDDEIRKYHYRGCKFSELTQNSNTKSLLAGSLKSIRGKSVSFMKANINEVADIMRDERYDKNLKELLDYINSLYKNTNPNFHSVLNELKYYKKMKSMKTHNDLVKVIRGGVRAILFDYYTELNTNTRRKLKERIETFWKQFKNIAEMNDIPYTDPVIKSIVESIKVLKNPYPKNHSQMKLKNKIKRIVSRETYGEESQRDETEKDESNNDSGIQTNYNTAEISSGQSFDSSSNSIKSSQERHEEYNTQRYMTLYTEEISDKAKSTKKTEIIPISANVMTRRPKLKKRPTTTSTPRERDVLSDRTEKIEMLRANHDADDTNLDISNSSHDTESGLMLELKHEPRTKVDYDKQQKQDKADELSSKSKHKNKDIISQYDAVIDVQLTNTELLKALGMFEPLRMDTKYDTGVHPRSAIQTKKVSTRSRIRPRSKEAQAEVKPQKPTAHTKSPSRYSKRNKPFYIKQLSNLRKNMAPRLSNEGHPVDQFIKDKNQNQKYFRRSDINTIGAEEFNRYVMKRINAMENELNELIQINDFISKSRMKNNNTYGVETRNITNKFEVKDKVDSKRKYMKENVIEESLNKDYDLNNKEVNDGHEFTTRYNKINTKSTNNTKSRKLNDIKKNAVNATVIDSKNTKHVTNNISKINVNVAKKLNKEVINNNATKSTISLAIVTNATNLERVVTTPTVGVTRRKMASSKPSYYDSLQENHPTVRNSQLDEFFDHVNDGIDIHM